MKKIVLISDTHGLLDKRFIKYLKESDEIWHAGDIGSLEITDELKKYAKLRAVFGNIDNQNIRSEFKQTLNFKCEDIKVTMTHISGSQRKYSKNNIENIKKFRPNIFVCGHSHILKVKFNKEYQLLHMNPGASGNYGIHKVKTILYFSIENKEIKNMRVIEIPRKSKISI